MKSKKVAIIGGGLTGVLLASMCHNNGINFILLEATGRLGGRIHTSYKQNEASIELGATWLGKKHTALTKLLKSLDTKIYAQELGSYAVYEPISTSPHQYVQLPPNEEPSYRITGGTESIIQHLKSKLPKRSILLHHPVEALEFRKNDVVIRSSQDYLADVVVSTIPPFLFSKTIHCLPALPGALQIIMSTTHTWMGESIKVGLRYKEPFWQQPGKSGTIFSNVGPISEMYEHNDHKNKYYALKGFFNGAYYGISKEERLRMVLDQLRKYFGTQVDDFMDYEEKVWRNEKHVFSEYEEYVLPHQNNGHDIYRQPYFNGKLLIAGSETASLFPGYMDGAVRSAQWVFNALHNTNIK